MDVMTKKEEIDPLRRIYEPIEKRKEDGTFVFYTSDKMRYVRGVDGSIRRSEPKINGKVARRIRRELRETK